MVESEHCRLPAAACAVGDIDDAEGAVDDVFVRKVLQADIFFY
jgi:hypothetical protein